MVGSKEIPFEEYLLQRPVVARARSEQQLPDNVVVDGDHHCTRRSSSRQTSDVTNLPADYTWGVHEIAVMAPHSGPGRDPQGR